MSDEKPFCTIDIPNVETAAWIGAVLNPNIADYLMCENALVQMVYDSMPSKPGVGRETVRTIQGVAQPGKSSVWRVIQGKLRHVGASYQDRKPPWLPPKPPERIDSYDVTYSKDGMKAGCVSLSLEEMKLMVEECEKQ